MSEGSKHRREWRFYVDDMIGFCEKVIAYMDGISRARFDGCVSRRAVPLPALPGWRKIHPESACRARLVRIVVRPQLAVGRARWALVS